MKGQVISTPTVLKGCIMHLYTVQSPPGVCPHPRVIAHSIRAQSTFVALLRNKPIPEIGRVATWFSIHTVSQHYSLVTASTIRTEFISSTPSSMMEVLFGSLLMWNIHRDITQRRKRRYSICAVNWSCLRCVPEGAPLPTLLPLWLEVSHWTFLVEKELEGLQVHPLYMPLYQSMRESSIQGQILLMKYLQSSMDSMHTTWCGAQIEKHISKNSTYHTRWVISPSEGEVLL